MMNQRELLFAFEAKYKLLYDIKINGVPIYAGLRDGVAERLVNGESADPVKRKEKKGKIFIRRILNSHFKISKWKKSETLIFTSAIFRRDQGRNLAAEFLLEKYSNAVIFEWPSGEAIFDKACFEDNQRDRYCPLDYYLVLYKLYMKCHRMKYKQLVMQCKERMENIFGSLTDGLLENEKIAIQYLVNVMPDSYAATAMSQHVFKKIFRKYTNVMYAIDFWGSARENIIPVLPSAPQSIELQHGIITNEHPGYIYPSFAYRYAPHFFERKLLVYGKATEKILTRYSIFKKNQMEIIGNPRIIKYKQAFSPVHQERKLILFTSQPFEQDGKGTGYYEAVIPVLKAVSKYMESNSEWKGFQLAIKLHPRENNSVKETYLSALPQCIVYDNSTQLYELLLQTSLHITANSTTLYEAAVFGAPTIAVMYSAYDPKVIFGKEIKVIKNLSDVTECLRWISEKSNYRKYLYYMKQLTNEFM